MGYRIGIFNKAKCGQLVTALACMLEHASLTTLSQDRAFPLLWSDHLSNIQEGPRSLPPASCNCGISRCAVRYRERLDLRRALPHCFPEDPSGVYSRQMGSLMSHDTVWWLAVRRTEHRVCTVRAQPLLGHKLVPAGEQPLRRRRGLEKFCGCPPAAKWRLILLCRIK